MNPGEFRVYDQSAAGACAFPAGFVSPMQALLLTANLQQAESLAGHCQQLTEPVSLDVAENLDAAFDRLAGSAVDVAVLDLVHPPPGTAAELVATTRARFSSLPILVIAPDATAAAEALAAGAQAFALSGDDVPHAIARFLRGAGARRTASPWRVLYATRGEPMRGASNVSRLQLEVVTLGADATVPAVFNVDPFPFDAVVVDLSDAATDLLSLLQDVVSRVGDLPVLAITDAGNRQLATAAIQLGAAHVVGKVGAWPVRLAHAIDQAALARQARLDAAAVRSNESRLRLLVESLPTGVGVLARDGTILAMNGAALAAIGTGRRDAVLRTNVLDHIASDDREQMRTLLAVVAEGRPYQAHVHWDSPDWTRRLEISGAPLGSGEGQVVLASIRDAGEDHAAIAAAERERVAAAQAALTTLREEHQARARQASSMARELETARARLADLEAEQVTWRAQADGELGAMRTALAGEAERAMLVERLQREIATLRDALSDAVREADAVRAAGMSHAQAEIDQLKRVVHDLQVERARDAEFHGRELERLHALTATQGQVQAELETARAMLEQTRSEQAGVVERTRQHVDDLQAELAHAREAHAREVAEQAHEIAALRQNLAAREREVAETRAALEQQVAQGQREVEQVEATSAARAEAMQREMGTLRHAIEASETERAQLRSALGGERAETSKLEAQIRATRAALDAREHELHELATQGDARETLLAARDRELAEARQQVSDVEARVRALELSLAERDARLQAAEDNDRERQAALEAARQLAADREEQLRATEWRITTLHADAEAIRRELDARRSALEASERLLIERIEERDAARSATAERDAQVRELQRALQDSEAQRAVARQLVSDRETELTAALSRCQDIEAQLGAARQLTADREAELRALQQLREDTEAQLGAARQRVSGREAELHSVQQLASECETRLRATVAQIANLEAQLATAHEASDARQVQLAAAESAIRGYEVQLASAAEALADHERIIEKARIERAAREAAIGELRAACDTREAELSLQAAELNALRDQVASQAQAREAAVRVAVERDRDLLDARTLMLAREAVLSTTATELTHARQQLADREIEVATTAALLRGASDRVADLEQQLEATRDVREGLVARLTAATDELARTQQWNAGLRVRLQETEQARDIALERASDAEAETARRLGDLESLLRAAERLVSDRERARAELAVILEAREAGLERFREELAAARERLAELEERARAAEQARELAMAEAAAAAHEAEQRIAAYEARERERRGTEAVGRVAADFVREVDGLIADLATGLAATPAEGTDRDRRLAAMRAAIMRAGRAREITQQFLAFSRNRQRRSERVPVGALVSSLVALLEQLTGEGVRVSIDPMPATLVTSAPREGIARVLLALVGAAVEALPLGGTIALATETNLPTSGAVEPTATLVVRVSGFGQLPLREPTSFDPIVSSIGAAVQAETDEEGQRYELVLPLAGPPLN